MQDGLGVEFFRIIVFAGVFQGLAEAIVGGIVVGGRLNGMPENGDAVPPIFQLNGSDSQAAGERKAPARAAIFVFCRWEFKRSFNPHATMMNRPMPGR